MKSIKTFVAVIALAASFGSFAAETVTATAATMDGAEAKIAAQAQAAGASSLQNYRSLYRQPRAYDCGTEQLSIKLLSKERLQGAFFVSLPASAKLPYIPLCYEKNVAVITFPFFP